VVRLGRDAPPVVGDPASPIGQQGDVYTGALARHGFVDRVVHHFPDEVVEATWPRRPDVHAWAFAYRLEALEDCDVLGTVGRGRSRSVLLQGHGRDLSNRVSESIRATRTCRSEALNRALILPERGAFSGHSGRTRTSNREATSRPTVSVIRASNVDPKYLTWVAQAGWSTDTTSVDRTSEIGRQ
jgi:hypothetical protein